MFDGGEIDTSNQVYIIFGCPIWLLVVEGAIAKRDEWILTMNLNKEKYVTGIN